MLVIITDVLADTTLCSLPMRPPAPVSDTVKLEWAHFTIPTHPVVRGKRWGQKDPAKQGPVGSLPTNSLGECLWRARSVFSPFLDLVALKNQDPEVLVL